MKYIFQHNAFIQQHNALVRYIKEKKKEEKKHLRGRINFVNECLNDQ